MSWRNRLITWSGIFLFFGIFLLAQQSCTPLTLPAIIGTYVSNEAASSLYDVDENCEPTTPLLEPTWDVVFHLNQEGSQVSGDALLQDLLIGAEDFAVIMSGTNPAGGQDVYFGGHVCNLVNCVDLYFSGTAEDTNSDGIADTLTSQPDDLHILRLDKQGNCTGYVVIPQFVAVRIPR